MFVDKKETKIDHTMDYCFWTLLYIFGAYRNKMLGGGDNLEVAISVTLNSPWWDRVWTTAEPLCVHRSKSHRPKCFSNTS